MDSLTGSNSNRSTNFVPYAPQDGAAQKHVEAKLKKSKPELHPEKQEHLAKPGNTADNGPKKTDAGPQNNVNPVVPDVPASQPEVPANQPALKLKVSDILNLNLGDIASSTGARIKNIKKDHVMGIDNIWIVDEHNHIITCTIYDSGTGQCRL